MEGEGNGEHLLVSTNLAWCPKTKTLEAGQLAWANNPIAQQALGYFLSQNIPHLWCE